MACLIVIAAVHPSPHKTWRSGSQQRLHGLKLCGPSCPVRGPFIHHPLLVDFRCSHDCGHPKASYLASRLHEQHSGRRKGETTGANDMINILLALASNVEFHDWGIELLESPRALHCSMARTTLPRLAKAVLSDIRQKFSGANPWTRPKTPEQKRGPGGVLCPKAPP